MPAKPAEIMALAAAHLVERGRLDLAREVARTALAEDPLSANAHSVLHIVCDAAGQWRDGFEHARRAAELAPDSPQLRYNLALSALRLDDYRAGFALMEARLDKPDWTGLAIAPSRAAERHRQLRPGEPVDGRHILVVTEQGLGDCIMFARYLPLLAARGARVTLACSPPLRPLFAQVAGVDALLSPPADQPLAKINLSQAEFDLWVPLLSLPIYFATEFATVPAAVPYLAADPRRVETWRRRYERAGRRGAAKIGIVFQANPVSASAIHRSVELADLAPLLRLPGVDWVSLQGGPAGRRLIEHYRQVIDAMDPAVALDEFAAATAATDLVISIDTMAAHCAGALGHPLWLLVPHSPHWAWGLGRDHTPWYPTARLFRQEARRNWPAAIEALTKALADFPEERRAQ